MTDSTGRPALPPMKITRVVAAPLFGESPKGGWSAEIRPEDSIHALIERLVAQRNPCILDSHRFGTDGHLLA